MKTEIDHKKWEGDPIMKTENTKLFDALFRFEFEGGVGGGGAGANGSHCTGGSSCNGGNGAIGRR